MSRAASGDPQLVWRWIDQAAYGTAMELQRRSLPAAKEIRARRRRLLDTIDALADQLGLDITSPSPRQTQVDAKAFQCLMNGEMRLEWPDEPTLVENRKQDRVPLL